MQILQTANFKKIVKKLPVSNKKEVDKVVAYLAKNPEVGQLKKGDLANVAVYKFHINNQLTLIAYQYDQDAKVITLLALGSHENFYRDLKRST